MNTLPPTSRQTTSVSGLRNILIHVDKRRWSIVWCQLISLLLTYALLLQLVPFRASAATVIAGTPVPRKPSATADQPKPDRVFNGEIAASANGVFVPEPQTGSGSNTIIDAVVSRPAPTGTRSVTVQSQADVSNIGSWQTLRDLNVAASHLTINVPPGLYGTFTVNGNSQLNFTAGTYNFANTFNLDGGAVIQATGVVTINVGQNLTVTSGALALGSYTSPGDVRLNVLGSSLNINGSSQVSGLVRGANATVSINNTAQVRGQVIANSFILNGGKVTGAVWPARTGGSLSIFGPRRFDRTTGSPNQYVEQFSLPAGGNSPFTLHIPNRAPDGNSRVSRATASLTLNGIDVLSQSDLNQNVASLDRVVTLAANNVLEVRVASDPGSYLIINIGGLVPSDITPPTISITSPASNSSTEASQITVSGTASDNGANASGVAHVYVNGIEASYNSANGTWSISNVVLNIGANQITARAVDQAGNEATMSITVTRQASNAPPTVEAGPDQTITLPNTASLHGTATDDGLPTGSTLSTSWSKVSGPGTVALANANALDTTASFSIAGTYVLSLTASDTALSTSDNVTITVQPQNQPPTVNAGANQTIALPHQVILNGTASDDGLPAGSSLSVVWSKASGPGTVTFNDPTLPQTAASFSDPGTYVLRLTASDTELTSTSDVTIAVNPENHPPSVNAGPDLLVTLPNGATLNGTATDDGWPAGSTLHISWSVISGPGQVTFSNPNSPTTAATFSAAGVYTLRLTASDGELSASDDAVVTVTPPNQPPNVNAGPDQTITLPISANLNGSVSDDGLPIGSSVATTWSKVSGLGTVTFGNANATATTASFSSAGVYVLRLTASDSELTATDDLTIAVNLPLLANDDAYAIGPNSLGISLPSQFSARAILRGAPFTKIEGLAISQDGKLYVAEAIGGKIVTVDLASNVATTDRKSTRLNSSH